MFTVIIPIYIVLLLFILRVRFNWSVFCTSDAFHIRIRNDRSEQVCVWGSIGACSVSLTASHAHTHTHKHPGDDRKHGKATSLYISESNCPLAYPSVQDSRWPHCRCRLCTKYQMWSFVSQVDQVLQNFAQCSAVGVSRSNDTIQA